MEPLIEIAIIFIAAAVLAYVAGLFKQPIIPAYILAGLILVLTGLVGTNTIISTISMLGIAFLLFIVGMEIDLKRIKDVSFISTVGGTLMCIILFGIGFLTGGFLGFSSLEAVYIGLVIAFSSTMIVLKILGDRSELDTLHGRITIGILLVQDILAIIALFVLSTLENFTFSILAYMLVALVFILIVLYLGNKYLFPIIFKYAARTEELLFITALAVCLLFIGIFEYFGFSIAIGAFLAGVTLGNLPYNIEIISLTKPIRDFFAVIFFVALGIQLNLQTIKELWVPILILLGLIIIVKPILTMFLISFFGYKKRPSYVIAVSLGQASEFSLILLVLGLSLNHVSQNLFSLVILLAIVSMTITAYLLEYEQWIYNKISKYLNFLERVSENSGHLEYVPRKIKKEVILIGYDRLGYDIFKAIKNRVGKKFIVVDYNPEVIKELVRKKVPCIYGDVGDVEILNRLNLKEANLIVSTVPDKHDSMLLIKKAKEANPKSMVFLTSMNVEDALDLYDAGADYVILPHFLGGERVSLMLEEVGTDIQKLLEHKLKHIKELKHRRRIGHRHPKKHRHK